MVDSNAKPKRAAFMMSSSPTESEMRSRRWVIRLSIYVALLVGILLGIALPRGWWPVILIWAAFCIAVFAWYLVTLNRNARQVRAESTPETRAAARRGVGMGLRWPSVGVMISAGFLFTAGFTGVRNQAWVFAASAFMFLIGVFLLIWSQRLKRS